jgi:hypothetical protein
MASISEEDQRAKMGFIDAFFDGFEDKAAYLSELYRAGRRDEARILCSCYIDGLALALYWPDARSKFCFVRVLKEHGGNNIFSYIHPKMLDEALSNLSESSNKWKAIHKCVSYALGQAAGKLYAEKEIAELLAPFLNADTIQKVKRVFWQGSFAAIVYDRFRVDAVHGFGPPNGITFDQTTFQGNPVPVIDFKMVHDCLKRVVAVCKQVSKQSGKFFGHDYK